MAAIVLSFVFNIIPLVILPVFYQNIPDTVPAFVDLLGNPVVSMGKSYPAIFRLPLMGVLLSIVCLVMYRIKLDGENQKLNQIIWRAAACITALKMEITSLEILFYEKAQALKFLRLAVLAIVITGAAILIYGAVKMYKNKIPFTEYKEGMTKTKIPIALSLVLYILIALMPLYIKG
jgi:uncharacterized membrane protein